MKYPIVPGSDGAGEVVEVGPKVTSFKKGDKVATVFNQGHQFGDIDIPAAGTGLGGVIDGTLREYGVFNESGLVKGAKNLNAIENSTLTCAAVTSWNALYGLKILKPGQVVLVQGTGGVSLFALQVCSRKLSSKSKKLLVMLICLHFSLLKLLVQLLSLLPLQRPRRKSSSSLALTMLLTTRPTLNGARLLAS